MTYANIYFKDAYWHVDFIDVYDKGQPAVGMFTTLEDANAAAREWTKGNYNNVTIVQWREYKAQHESL